MNREQRRNFVKKAHKRGMSKSQAEKLLKIADTEGNTYTASQEVNTGDKVKLKVDVLKSKKNYDIMNPMYKEFVEKSEGVVYTAVRESKVLLHLEEEPRWLFWCGDLEVAEAAPSEPEDASIMTVQVDEEKENDLP